MALRCLTRNIGGYVAAAQKRSHQWCLTLIPNNTEITERILNMSLFSVTNQERPYEQLLDTTEYWNCKK